MPDVVPWTRSDLDRLPDDGNRYEVLAGELLVTPPPSDVHQGIVDWLLHRIVPFVVTHDLGRVQTPRSVVVIGGSQLEPDLMVRPLAPLRGWEHAPIPLLVVEVLSRSTRRRDLGPKRAFYVASGVAEYWAADREARHVVRITADREEPVARALQWRPPGTAATLEIDVAGLFDEVLGAR